MVQHRKALTLVLGWIGLLVGIQVASAGGREAAQQISVPRIDEMPNLPSPLKIRDWRQAARDYDAIVFDLHGHDGRPPLVLDR